MHAQEIPSSFNDPIQLSPGSFEARAARALTIESLQVGPCLELGLHPREQWRFQCFTDCNASPSSQALARVG